MTVVAGRKKKRRRKRQVRWFPYYCKVSGFEAWGSERGPSLELQLSLLEPVPKVETLTMTVYCQEPELKLEDVWIPEHGHDRSIVSHPHDPRGYASRRPDGSANVSYWWDPRAVAALLSPLLSGRQLYVNFNAEEFYRNLATAESMQWYTLGSWRADVVGEQSHLY